jgi:predicted DNA-binding WGR domain protein
MLILRRTDHDQNMARFYAMSLETSLFGDVMLIRRWGRIGTYGRVRSEWFDCPSAATERMAAIAALKGRRGYQRYLATLDLEGVGALRT